MKKGLVIDREAQMIGVYLFEDKKVYRGIPRKKIIKKTKIYAGDYVLGNVIDSETFAIESVEERKNFLVRPPVANVDKVIIVFTLKKPDFDSFLLDNLLVVYEYLGAEPVIVFNKIDLLNDDERKELKRWKDIYINAGYDFIPVSAITGEGIDTLKEHIKGNISVFAGPSGVGKSSILSALTGIELKVSQISEKTERGRHTTTGVRLYRFNENSFIGDTPGFSSVDALYFMEKREVKNYFREFLRYRCRFSNCTHTDEPGCLVKEAVKKGEISKERYENYLKIIGSSK
ncbi:MAG TPA: ribosome small subunit-dependent GTPase A [Persephonella sp.]|uniref:Small ribosomal subunit biogenesis GTPase RsgA n=1 Tax=Persephonella marina (strain DSM 14350 / EX-H1) TaxID=123214 RepID=C0QPX9_PERMH|nr:MULTISPECIES: ribosome small subunit-dependent GTPase A [Persephonella]ACO04039.1 ribosome small subunit-dependent GTPase A [Persephonella marina EX-H1]HCB69660.1 ribosome small subunit-dependent GTPase A [Persephonella sp.]